MNNLDTYNFLWFLMMPLLFYMDAPVKLYAILLTIHTGKEIGECLYEKPRDVNVYMLTFCYLSTIFHLFLESQQSIQILFFFSLMEWLHRILETYDLYFRYSRECIFENIFLFYLSSSLQFTSLGVDYLVFDISFLLLELFYKDTISIGEFGRVYYITLFSNLKKLLF